MTIKELVGHLQTILVTRGNMDVLIMADDLPIAELAGVQGPDLLCQIRLVEYHEDEQGGFVVLES